MKRKILVVEDEESLRRLCEEELREEGYEVITAEDGREALRKFREEKPDLVVLDIVMPRMDGIEALGQILGKDRTVPVILHTSHPRYQEEFMSWAADAYLLKSSGLAELKEKIRELLANNGQGRRPVRRDTVDRNRPQKQNAER